MPWPSELRPAGRLLASGIFIDREPEVRSAFEAAGLEVVGPIGRGRLGRPRGRPRRLRPSRRAARTIGPVPLLAIVLPVHIALAIGLFLPSLLLPFALRTDRPATESRNRVVQGMLRLQGSGTVVIGLGLALTGILLVAALGIRLLEQPWLLVALAIYGLNLAIAFFIQRPSHTGWSVFRAARDDAVWRARPADSATCHNAMAGPGPD